MALPWTFANATTLFTSRLDDNYNALGALTVIPCTATGTNTIALTPAANTPTISAYSNLAPVFVFLAAATNSGATTVNVNGIGAKNLYKNNGATAVGSGDIVIGGLYLVSYNSALNGAVGGFVIDNPATTAAQNTTTTRLITGGPLTYTSPAGVIRHRVTLVGPGGGGGAQVTNAGSNGSAATSFQVNGAGTAWTAGAGTGGPSGSATTVGGAGGTGGTDGTTGTLIYRQAGGRGDGSHTSTTFVMQRGGISALGGSAPATGATATGQTPQTNSGGGGGGGGVGPSGGGGGAGEFVSFWVTGMTTAIYTIGAGGNGGNAGTNAGGAGAAGIVICEEYYQ